ncbi:MAG: DUF1987 domain-containing protein [Bacteroidales bacterium]|nr:DUF1987 domain-containing protein [Bacteroidales bacterium]
MEELRIPPDKNVPDILLRPNGVIKITGRSIHENIIKYYDIVYKWIVEYVESPADVTCVDMNLEYLNSASAKAIYNLLEKIISVSLKNKKFLFNWYYEDGDDDIYERGQYFASSLNVPFNFIKLGQGSVTLR